MFIDLDYIFRFLYLMSNSKNIFSNLISGRERRAAHRTVTADGRRGTAVFLRKKNHYGTVTVGAVPNRQPVKYGSAGCRRRR
jgi:hypothetical protein